MLQLQTYGNTQLRLQSHIWHVHIECRNSSSITMWQKRLTQSCGVLVGYHWLLLAYHRDVISHLKLQNFLFDHHLTWGHTKATLNMVNLMCVWIVLICHSNCQCIRIRVLYMYSMCIRAVHNCIWWALSRSPCLNESLQRQYIFGAMKLE